MKQIEKSAEKDYNDLKAEYQMQVEEIHNMDLSNKELKRNQKKNKDILKKTSISMLSHMEHREQKQHRKLNKLKMNMKTN